MVVVPLVQGPFVKGNFLPLMLPDSFSPCELASFSTIKLNGVEIVDMYHIIRRCTMEDWQSYHKGWQIKTKSSTHTFSVIPLHQHSFDFCFSLFLMME